MRWRGWGGLSLKREEQGGKGGRRAEDLPAANKDMLQKKGAAALRLCTVSAHK